MIRRFLAALPWVLARRADIDALRRETHKLRLQLVVTEARMARQRTGY